ncbi:hypothetical protein L1987_14835 [Smallanthus sonchifolius]|uniref:Uncharacterized protein n=1 Tax=Smallanthus sonchifolius TaxID=185202 RepID=A0ACB9J4X7_9ASTR|nr:hypothetical protein L1987_14835 [Smallanthus sonchifolius]
MVYYTSCYIAGWNSFWIVDLRVDGSGFWGRKDGIQWLWRTWDMATYEEWMAAASEDLAPAFGLFLKLERESEKSRERIESKLGIGLGLAKKRKRKATPTSKGGI